MTMAGRKKKNTPSVSLQKCLVFEEANDTMFISDIKTASFIDVNKAACRRLGYSRKELLRMNPADIDAPEYAKLVPRRIREITRKGSAVFETVHVTKNGKTIPTEMSVKRVYHGGRPTFLAVARDITERKRQEELLRVSEQKFKDLVETTTDWVWETDEDGKYTYSSPKVKDLLGYRPSDLIGKTPFRFMPKQEAKRIQKIFKERAGSRQPFYYLENTCRRKDGRDVVLETSGIPIFDEKGRFKGYRGIDRDITERKKTENKVASLVHDLSERVKELRCLYDLTNLVEKPRITSEELFRAMANRICAAYQYPEITRARIIFEGDESRSDGFKTSAWKQSADIIVFGKKAGAVDVYYLKKMPISDEGPFLKEERDMLDEIVERLGRVVERKRAEEALEASEANYRSIFETANDGIVIRDVETYKVVDVNKKACEMFLYPKKKMMGLGITAINSGEPPHTNEKLLELLGRAGSGEPLVFEWVVKDKFKRAFWIEVSLKRAVIGGKYRLLSLIRDITERKAAERIKDEFVGMVSHELRTPLTAIRESIAIVLDGTSGVINDRQKESLSIGKRNIDRLSRLIGDLLDLQGLRLDKWQFNLAEDDINRIAADAKEMMLPAAKAKGLEILIKTAEGLPSIRVDRDRITQVFVNLLNNAIKFTDKGSITIETSGEGANAVRVSVIDTGIGIPQENTGSVFHSFSQAAPPSRRTPGSTGLGLAISMEIVQKHGGKIWSNPRRGRGARSISCCPLSKEGRGSLLSQNLIDTVMPYAMMSP